ncbi:MAG: AAA family ATPase [Nannocystis sp.]|nr:AAA family ATPase [Nannocystis sp.]MBA3545046.1 AAA family ATPase [Nannocystis sp.]
MLFRAQNLGPIRDAELDLSKNLIILAGPNNSGKTYLGWALYGLSQFNKPLPCVRELVDAAIASPTGAHDTGPFPEFLVQFATEFCALYAEHIHRDFSAAPDAFASTLLTLVTVPTALPPREGSFYRIDDRIFQIDFRVHEGMLRVQVSGTRTDKRNARPSNVGTFESVPLSPITSETKDLLAKHASQKIIQYLRWALFRRSFTIFPVERIATTIFARELLLRRVEVLDEENTDEPEQLPSAVRPVAGRYPLPIRHSLRIAADLSAYSREESEFRDLADELEGSVLQGRFTVSEHGDMLFFPSASPKQSLGLHQSASVVKSLSALVFYFRHLAQQDDHLIIDEPELNLHPDNQRKVARVLAKAANRGIKIMMSTHSDYLIGEFNNLLMLSRDTPQATAVRQELGYDAESVLKPADVGVYLVQDGLCTPVEVKETGFELKTFEDAFHSMNRDAQTIYNRIFAESE